MTVTDIGDERCTLCKRKAVHHRLTPRGVLYCLELARHAHRRWFEAVDIDPGVVYRMPVLQLQRAEFPEGVGAGLVSRASL
ncbi:hypothetical protein LCGC14_1956040 [marine sediment metagenome]|uniref:Uncharacterized protein n=1 Tax=marine sediment metagenome TaxID=412755 RepID=A0A0F9HUE5_9ZZZZ